jgi:hypothetical protein
MLTRAVILLSVTTALGCRSDFIAYCTAPPPIAVIVAVIDSVSGLSIADSARGVAKLDTAIYSLRLQTPPPRLVGGTELGTYQVVIDRPGYREWLRSGIVVSRRGGCGNPISAEVVARLQPSP